MHVTNIFNLVRRIIILNGDFVFVNVRLSKWGNSLGAVIPKAVVDDAGLKENAEVTIRVEDVKASTSREVFGTYKVKQSAQSIKNWLRKEWEE